jgi:hypothetical protein
MIGDKPWSDPLSQRSSWGYLERLYYVYLRADAFVELSSHIQKTSHS